LKILVSVVRFRPGSPRIHKPPSSGFLLIGQQTRLLLITAISSKIVEMIRLIYCLLITLFSLQSLAETLLNEEVIFIPKKLLIGSVALETTIFRPDGDGPFPLVVINHGKSFGNSHFQNRYRPLSPIRYFLERNYVVFVPMRQGFSKSGGNYSDGSCSMRGNGVNQAEDIQPVIEYAHTLPYVDKAQTLIVGQSHGGWTTLAYGASNPDKSVKGLVNFAGGLKNENCSGWQSDLYRTAEDFGKETKVPTIWFYGDNDSFFSRQISDAMYENYKTGNPKSEFVAYGTFGSDSHLLFTSNDGRAVWEPYLTKFLTSIGMPSKVLNPQFQPSPRIAAPSKTYFAEIGEIEKIPRLTDSVRKAYNLFLEKPYPRAFAISENNNYGWEYGGDDPLAGAINRCEKKSSAKCKLYAVDDYVVW